MDAPPPLSPEVWAALPPAVVALLQWQAQQIVRLSARIVELEALVKRNSTNSSKPPSSDPPSVKRPPPKPASGKQAGGQLGHAKAERALVEHPDHVQDCLPSVCRRCQQPLAGTDPAPLRHQVTELPPPPAPVVTEYRRHRLECSHCGTTTCAALPAGVRGQDGPRLQALCVLLTGAYRLSKRKATQLLADLHGVTMSPAQVCATEAEVGQVLVPVVAEALEGARQHSANVDETSLGRGRWLWTFVTAVATVFQVVTARNRVELQRLLGAHYRHVLTSDRHSLYGHWPAHLHQYCWAHLRRDFQAMIDRHDAGSAIGVELLALSDEMFGWWYRVRDGTLSKLRFTGKLHAERPWRTAFRATLERGQRCCCAKTAGTCRKLLDRELSLFTFAWWDGVEPTNNAAERALRHGVLWRKQSKGPQSAAGATYLANVWTVVETCRQHGRNTWAYLQTCITAAQLGMPLPSLLPTQTQHVPIPLGA